MKEEYKTIDMQEVLKVIMLSKDGFNKKFLKASHSLWFRFKNYDKNPPYALYTDDECCSLIFGTHSRLNKYVNVYEVCTIQGKEGKGYATKLWENYIKYSVNQGMKRLKISCTPDSLGWHIRNGLVFWGVDKQGSLKSDQPLFSTRDEQIKFRHKAINNPEIALPDTKVIQKLKQTNLEELNLSANKIQKTINAINKYKLYYLRDSLYGL